MNYLSGRTNLCALSLIRSNDPDYHTCLGDRHIWAWQCHQIYGSCFRFRPDSVLFNTPTAQRTIYDAKSNVKKGAYYRVWPLNSESVNTWATVDKQKHARKRRILNAAFSDKGWCTNVTYPTRLYDTFTFSVLISVSSSDLKRRASLLARLSL